jgi:hypothetical protein
MTFFNFGAAFAMGRIITGCPPVDVSKEQAAATVRILTEQLYHTRAVPSNNKLYVLHIVAPVYKIAKDKFLEIR